MSTTPFVTLYVSAEGRITRALGSARALFGGDVVGAPIADVLADVDWAAASAPGAAATASLAPSGKPVAIEVRRFVEGDLLVHVGAPERTTDVPPPWDRRISALSVPIADGFVEAQRKFMLAVLDADPNLVFVKDALGRFMFVNAAMARDFGVDPEAMVAQPNGTVHPHREEVAAFAAIDRDVLATGREVCVEERFTRPDGQALWYETRKRPLLAPDGTRYVLAVATDVTARRAAEQTLAETRDRLALAVKAGRLGVWDWNLETTDVFFDARWKEMLGYDEHEVPNDVRFWQDALHPDDRARILEAVERAIADPACAGFEHEFRLRRKDGGYEWICGSGVVTRDAAGRGTRVTGFHLDVQDRKEREAALRRANDELSLAARMKDEFLANMSHELRTPLNAVLGQAELLAEEIHGPLTDAQRRAIGMIESSGLHLLGLIGDLLDLAKIGAGKVELAPVEIDLPALCRKALAAVRPEATRKSLRVALSEDGASQTVVADPVRLERILGHLIGNAVRFTDPGGRVGVDLRGSARAVRIEIWDTGVGIPPEEAGRLFQPFVQLDGSLHRAHGGAGLGLALAKRLVDLHGGSLAVESEPGRGARFVVELPRT